MTDVSHETFERLAVFQEELLRWNKRINLIGRGTTADIAERHVADSLQLFEMAALPATWCDMGSGGGFPGLVVAICASELDTEFVLIESDGRKAEFLSHICRMFSLNARILARRIEQVEDIRADVVSARALAPLKTLLAYGSRLGTAHATYLFPKGETYQSELDAAHDDWRFSVETIPSKTSQNSVILKIKDLARA